MPRSKLQNSPDQSPNGRDTRRRVVKACQRCRLKKCKCDGTTPCTRCKSDDAICAYGNHKKTDKTVFRKGYVQMLERQHAQLIAGLQELYHRTQTGQGWTQAPLEVNDHGQALTHKILEGLGVLRGDEWDDGNIEHSLPDGQGLEQQFQQNSRTVDDDSSMTNSPTSTAGLSPIDTQTAFPNSTIMAKRRLKYQMPAPSVTQLLNLSSISASQPFGPFSYATDTNNILNTSIHDQDLALKIPPSGSTLNGNDSSQQYSESSDSYAENDDQSFGDLDWLSIPNDMMYHSIHHRLPLSVQ